MFAENVYFLLLATFIQSFGASVGSVISQTMLRDTCQVKERAQIFNIIGMSLAFSPALGPLLGNYINEYFDWRYNYGLVTSLVCGLFIYSFFKLNETLPTNIQKRTLKDVKNVSSLMIKDPFIWICSSLIAICNANIFSFFAEGPFIFVHNLGLSEDLYGWVGVIISLSMLVGGYLNKRMIRKQNPEQIIILGSSLMMAGALIYLGTTLFIRFQDIKGTVAIWSIMLTLFATFLGNSLVIPNTLSIALKHYKDHLGTAGSLFGFSYYILISILTAMMSGMHNGTILPLPIFMMVISIFAYTLSRGLTTKKRMATIAQP
jgi:polar amino acid transport system substrate-binding protein